MKRLIVLLCLAILFTGFDAIHAKGKQSPRLWDIKKKKELSLHEVIPDLKRAKLVFMGEHHDSLEHHIAQLQLIQALKGTGIPIAIGVEMFHTDSQYYLDRWANNELTEAAFRKVYDKNWELWPLYRDIFIYARDNRIPVIGLNVPREISRQVAKEGFGSLTPEQRSGLPVVECKVSRNYREFVERAYGAHGHSAIDFNNFCEAQLLWDSAMAVRAIDYLKKNPKTIMIVLTGSGHAWKQGIPDQVAKRSDLPYRVILPEEPGMIDEGGMTTKEADYIWMGIY